MNMSTPESLRCLDLFSGIGGMTMGFERCGIQTIAFCELNLFCQQVLAKHWPKVPLYSDVCELTAAQLQNDGLSSIDIIAGGFPCQDISRAGKQAGIAGSRSRLWNEFRRLISELRPKYAVVENVSNLLSGGRGEWFGQILGDLAEIGYDAEWHCFRASQLGARHRRDRLWLIAYPSSIVSDCKFGPGSGTPDALWSATNANRAREQGYCEKSFSGQLLLTRKSLRAFASVCRMPDLPSSQLCRSTDGISDRSHRLRALGNSIVPQVAAYIGCCISRHHSRLIDLKG